MWIKEVVYTMHITNDDVQHQYSYTTRFRAPLEDFGNFESRRPLPWISRLLFGYLGDELDTRYHSPCCKCIY